ncbi:hypothetical protein [Streptomyces sp. NPDC101455]|uniref:hypothetical protein n=1 Tax=Streptomyces sp. NPDC101455 TaxID=3366142 RepID=UPI0037F16E46
MDSCGTDIRLRLVTLTGFGGVSKTRLQNTVTVRRQRGVFKEGPEEGNADQADRQCGRPQDQYEQP